MNWIAIYLLVGAVITLIDFLNLKYRYPNKLRADLEKARANNIPVGMVFVATIVICVILWQIPIYNFIKEKSWKGEVKHERKTRKRIT